MVGLQDKEMGRLFEEGGQVIIVVINIAVIDIDVIVIIIITTLNIKFIVMTYCSCNSSSIIAVFSKKPNLFLAQMVYLNI